MINDTEHAPLRALSLLVDNGPFVALGGYPRPQLHVATVLPAQVKAQVNGPS